MNKQAEMLTDNLVQLILVAAGIFLLVMLFWTLLEPNFNKADEIAKVYFEDLEEQLGIAKGGGVGNFYMLRDTSDEEYYVVYMGDNGIYTEGEEGKTFLAFKDVPNFLCLCFWDRENDLGDCKNCVQLESGAIFKGSSEDSWIIGRGNIIKINFKDGKYYFSVEKKDGE